MGAKRVSFCGYLCLLLSLSLLIVDLIRRHHAPKMKITCNSKNVFISSGACTKTISHLLLTTTIRRVQEAYQDKIKTTCTKARAKCICSRLAQVTLNWSCNELNYPMLMITLTTARPSTPSQSSRRAMSGNKIISWTPRAKR